MKMQLWMWMYKSECMQRLMLCVSKLFWFFHGSSSSCQYLEILSLSDTLHLNLPAGFISMTQRILSFHGHLILWGCYVFLCFPVFSYCPFYSVFRLSVFVFCFKSALFWVCLVFVLTFIFSLPFSVCFSVWFNKKWVYLLILEWAHHWLMTHTYIHHNNM